MTTGAAVTPQSDARESAREILCALGEALRLTAPERIQLVSAARTWTESDWLVRHREGAAQ